MTNQITTQTARPWYALESDLALKELESRPDGLTEGEAERRLARYGPNRLRPPRRQSPLVRFLNQFHNVLIYILLAAALVTALLEHWVDTGVILGVVLINGLVGFIQEGKAEKAMEAIRNMLSIEAAVLRDHRRVQRAAHLLVPGDIVLLQSGDKVPADLRLLRTKELRIEEAALTGESVPVEKSTQPVPEHAAIGDRSCQAFSGTLVTYGTGTGLVVATGDATEIGRISGMLAHVQPLATPLLRKMGEFGQRLSAFIVIGSALTFAVGVWVRGFAFSEMFLASVGLAVAAIPEGLPAIVTITLAIGVQRMSRRHAIIRRLPAVETLGSVTVICSDKTGTLTRNEMTVQTIATARHLVEVSGVGYDPHGDFCVSGVEVTAGDQPELLETLRAGFLCNDAAIEHVDSEWKLHGDPTEGALFVAGLKAGLEPAFEHETWPRTDVIPFESQHRFMATLHHDHAGHGFIYVKGAPERVLDMCHAQRSGGEDHPLDLPYWRARIEDIAARGQRVLAVASTVAGPSHRELRFTDLEGGLSMLGLFGIIDPPRSEAVEAVRSCQSAGIAVKMITGDHAGTARAIGAQMGIGNGVNAVTGLELDAVDDHALPRLARGVDVFARTSPEHKLRLVQSLQRGGEIVAMTGDGVNDAPALKRADVGVAMGIKGTEVAKEAAEMVLADDNFASIVHAVEEGRTVYDNIKKAILFILPTNGAEALVIIAAIAFGRVLPLTPVQILWVNMVTAVTLALALSFEPPESDVMRRPPRRPQEALLSRFLVWRITFVSLLGMLGTFALFLWEREHGASIEVARTVSVNTLVVFEACYLMNTRYLSASVLNRDGLLGNPFALGAIALVLVIQALFTYAPGMERLFDTAPIGPAAWARIVAVGVGIFLLVEAEKAWMRARSARAPRRRPV